MPLAFIIFSLNLLFSLHISAVTTDTISAGKALVSGDDKLVSSNGRFALGFFQPGPGGKHAPKHWYVGIWFDKISEVTPIWVANRENPVVGHRRMSKLAISSDGNLVIVDQATESTVWSTRANGTAGDTTAVLLDNGNLVLRRASGGVVWQSFDYPTDVILNDAKIGLDKVTGLNRRVVSKKNLIDPAPGKYCLELDTNDAVGRYVFKLCNSSIVYWSTGEWNGHYFDAMPEMSGRALFNFEFVNNSTEEYFKYSLQDKSLITITILGSSGQLKSFFWLDDSKDWTILYTLPEDQCNIYATCGPFAIGGCPSPSWTPPRLPIASPASACLAASRERSAALLRRLLRISASPAPQRSRQLSSG